MQINLLETHWKTGDRVSVSKLAPTGVYGFGLVECECTARPGWFYVRFPQGETVLVQWVYMNRPE